MAVEGCESFSFSTGTAPAARAADTSTRRQLERVPRISSWISSSSVSSLRTRGGIKPACRTPPAPAEGQEGMWVRAECRYYCHLQLEFLQRIRTHVGTHFLTQKWNWEMETPATSPVYKCHLSIASLGSFPKTPLKKSIPGNNQHDNCFDVPSFSVIFLPKLSLQGKYRK